MSILVYSIGFIEKNCKIIFIILAKNFQNRVALKDSYLKDKKRALLE